MKVLLCSPKYFDVLEHDPDNLHMDPDDRPDRPRAFRQHQELVDFYDKLGLEVHLIPPVNGLVDMAFTANCGLVIGDKVILSNFKPERRRAEKLHFRNFFEEQGYRIYELPPDLFFEGAGDAILYRNKIIVGYGFRTSKGALPRIEKVMGREVVPVKLINPGEGKKNLYHFDTTATVLAEQEILIAHPPAYSKDSLRRLEKIAGIIPASYEDAANLALNAVIIPARQISSSGRIYLQSKMCIEGFSGVVVTSSLASEDLKANIAGAGYVPITLDLREFLKSGGGAFCLTNVI